MSEKLSRVKNGCTVVVEKRDNGSLWITATGKTNVNVLQAINTLNYTKYDPEWAMRQILSEL